MSTETDVAILRTFLANPIGTGLFKEAREAFQRLFPDVEPPASLGVRTSPSRTASEVPQDAWAWSLTIREERQIVAALVRQLEFMRGIPVADRRPESLEQLFLLLRRFEIATGT